MNDRLINGFICDQPTREELNICPSTVQMHRSGRSRIGQTIIDGSPCFIKIKDDIQELLLEEAGYRAMQSAGYNVVSSLDLRILNGSLCAVMPKISSELLFTHCLQEDADGISAVMQKIYAQFRHALTTIDTLQKPLFPNAKYYGNRSAVLEQVLPSIQQRLGAEFLERPLVINGIHSHPIIYYIRQAMYDVSRAASIPHDQLAVTHGDPGDLNIFVNGTLIDYETAGLNDPVSESAALLQWQLFLGPTYAPRYHTTASPLYKLAQERPGFSVKNEQPNAYTLKQPMRHRLPAAIEALDSYGPDPLAAVRPGLRGAFGERFSMYWTFRSLTPLSLSQFTDDDLKAACLSIGLFGSASISNDPQAALVSAIQSLD